MVKVSLARQTTESGVQCVVAVKTDLRRYPGQKSGGVHMPPVPPLVPMPMCETIVQFELVPQRVGRLQKNNYGCVRIMAFFSGIRFAFKSQDFTLSSW